MREMDDVLPDVKLQFNIKYPTLEECYAYGYTCALSDLHADENPYQHGSKEWEHWSEGWEAGFYGEKPLFHPTESDVMTHLEHVEDEVAVNDQMFQDLLDGYLTKVLEIASVIAVSAILSYQVIDLVA